MYAKATRVRESRSWLFVSCLVAPGLAVFVVPAAPPWAAPLAAFATMFAFLFAWALWPKSDEGRVVASADGLRLGDRLLVKRSQIHSAHVRNARDVSWLCLQLKTGWVDVALADAGDESDLLRSLRLDASGIVARYSAACDRRGSGANVLRTLLTVGVPPVAIGFVFHASHGVHSVPLAIASLAVLLASTVGQLLASARSFEQIWVGADGIRLRRPLSRARFVPFASVESVRLERCDLVVQLLGGREVAWHGGRWNEPFPVLRAMADRIDRGLRAHRASVTSEMVGHLARGSRSIAAWLRDLRRASDPDQSTYRVATLPPDELWKTIENASAPPTARAGAAVALERTLDDRGKKRLRDIAAACASERLRLALEAAASDARVEERLAALVD